ncbi:MAG: hypothetical protein LBF17_06490 [Mediterranea sp.]|jgi:alpha-amylase|nr:hypothetical protein [Mediterranea sp.]
MTRRNYEYFSIRQTFDNEELNALLTTIKNQDEELAKLHEEPDKLKAKTAKPKAAPKKKAAKPM